MTAGAVETEAPVVVRRSRAGSGGALLLLHGLANSATVWNGFVEHYSGLETRAADMPWRGDGVPGWSHRDDLPGRVAEAMREASHEDGVVVVAHSFSANLLLALFDRELASGGDPVARYGVRGMVLVSPFYRPDPHDFRWADISRYLNDFHLIMADGIRVHAGTRVGADLRHEMSLRVRDFVGPYGWTRFYQTYLDTPWLRLEALRVPCLVLSGEQDFAAPSGEALALAGRLPDARVHVLPGCGHFLMSESPSRFAGLVDEFVRTSCPTPAPPTGRRPAAASRPTGEHTR